MKFHHFWNALEIFCLVIDFVEYGNFYILYQSYASIYHVFRYCLAIGPIWNGFPLRYDEMASKYSVEYIAGGNAFSVLKE